MRIIADMHTHTIASGHAYSTVNELAAEAARKGLAAIAITDHGPALPGGPHEYHFGAIRFIPSHLYGVRIFLGVEANVVDAEGNIDLAEGYLGKLDFIMAGFHERCGFDNHGRKQNTETLLKVMANPLVKAISHPGNPIYPIDQEEVVKASLATGTALEINNSSFFQSRTGSRPNCESLAELIARHRSLVMVGSDAHIAQGVGVFDEALEALAKAGVAEEQVVNSSMEKLLAFLGLEA
ncbi:MAG: phosphatase [Geobacter sp.]|nr:phosphatase [Geobacter sp.]